MAKDLDKKLADLAKESDNDFQKLDKMEKEYELDASPDADSERQEESKFEKALDQAPIIPPNAPNNPVNPGSPGSL